MMAIEQGVWYLWHFMLFLYSLVSQKILVTWGHGCRASDWTSPCALGLILLRNSFFFYSGMTWALSIWSTAWVMMSKNEYINSSINIHHTTRPLLQEILLSCTSPQAISTQTLCDVIVVYTDLEDLLSGELASAQRSGHRSVWTKARETWVPGQHLINSGLKLHSIFSAC